MINSLCKICVKIIPVDIRDKMKPKLIPLINHLKLRKRRFGNLNPDITFYVIRKESNVFGFFAIWRFVLPHIAYAVENNYIPIIDFKNYYMSSIQHIRYKNKTNAWEYYFEQPFPGWTLDEVYKSKNVILTDFEIMPYVKKFGYEELPMKDDEFKYWCNIYRKYTLIDSEILEKVRKIKEETFPKGERVLGVVVRREFTSLKMLNENLVNNHPEQSTLETYIEDIYKFMNDWNCSHVFISADDSETAKIMKKQFGQKCLLMERPRSNMFQNGEPVTDVELYLKEFSDDKENYRIKIAKDYLIETLLLSECTCLLAGRSGGTYAAYIMNGGNYEKMHIYNKGSIKLDGHAIKKNGLVDKLSKENPWEDNKSIAKGKKS